MQQILQRRFVEFRFCQQALQLDVLLLELLEAVSPFGVKEPGFSGI